MKKENVTHPEGSRVASSLLEERKEDLKKKPAIWNAYHRFAYRRNRDATKKKGGLVRHGGKVRNRLLTDSHDDVEDKVRKQNKRITPTIVEFNIERYEKFISDLFAHQLDHKGRISHERDIPSIGSSGTR